MGFEKNYFQATKTLSHVISVAAEGGLYSTDSRLSSASTSSIV